MIGNIIRQLRLQHNYTQNALSERLNLSPSAIGMYEQNRRLPDIDTLSSLANIFSVSSDYLLEITDNSEQYTKAKYKRLLSDTITTLLDEMQMSVEFLASITKIRKQRIQDILQGAKPDVNELILISESLNESTDFILGLTDDHAKYKKNLNHYSEDSFVRVFDSITDGYTDAEKAEMLDITIANLRKLSSGDEAPSPKLLSKIAQAFGKSTDFLLGISKRSRKQNTNKIYPFEMDEISILRLQSLLGNDDDEYYAKELGISNDEFYFLYHYGFIPHISVLTKLCSDYHVSSDYLLGLSKRKEPLKEDEFILQTLNDRERNLLDAFRQLNIDNQDIVIGDSKKTLKEQKYEDTVAAESISEKTTKKSLA